MIYLAGPITNKDPDALTWKTTFHNLGNRSWARIIDSARLDDVWYNRSNTDDGLTTSQLAQQKSIVTRDRNDVANADYMVLNLLEAEAASIGSMIELGWADAHRIPVITIMNDTNVHNHAFVRELSGWVVSSVEEAAVLLGHLVGYTLEV